jgi:hypothetical protein
MDPKFAITFQSAISRVFDSKPDVKVVNMSWGGEFQSAINRVFNSESQPFSLFALNLLQTISANPVFWLS